MNIVEQIHAEIDAAEDVILQESINLVAKNQVEDKDHIELMRKLGFVNAEVVEDATNKMKTAFFNKELAERVMYYKQMYPFQKFLTIEKFDEICTKYNLTYAPVGSYKKNVPPKNLKEIANAKELLYDDIHETSYVITKINRTGEKEFERFLEYLGKKKPEFTNREVHALHEKDRGSNPAGWEFGKSSDNMVFYDTKRKHYFDFVIDEYTTIDRSGLFIAAPINHFDTIGLVQDVKGFFKKVTVTVFRYVQGGIQVLSKWGLEGEDPDLVQGILN